MVLFNFFFSILVQKGHATSIISIFFTFFNENYIWPVMLCSMLKFSLDREIPWKLNYFIF